MHVSYALEVSTYDSASILKDYVKMQFRGRLSGRETKGRNDCQVDLGRSTTDAQDSQALSAIVIDSKRNFIASTKHVFVE